MDKRYQLESLNVTKMHIKAVQTTTKTYRQFLDEHDIEKVERLQDTLVEMIDDACEINETLNTSPSAFEVDEDEIEREYDSICADIQLPVPPLEYPTFVSETYVEQNGHVEMVPLVS